MVDTPDGSVEYVPTAVQTRIERMVTNGRGYAPIPIHMLIDVLPADDTPLQRTIARAVTGTPRGYFQPLDAYFHRQFLDEESRLQLALRRDGIGTPERPNLAAVMRDVSFDTIVYCPDKHPMTRLLLDRIVAKGNGEVRNTAIAQFYNRQGVRAEGVLAVYVHPKSIAHLQLKDAMASDIKRQ